MGCELRIPIEPIVGENCVTQTQGKTIHERIHGPLQSGQHVELDFAGVKVFSSPFFNASIGLLLKDIEASRLNELLRVEHLSAVGRELLRHVIDHSKEYYGSAAAREALDRIWSEAEGDAE
jgi:hypothetical protein